MSTAARQAQSRKADISEVLGEQVRNRVKSQTKTAVKEEAFPNIQANTFFKIVFSEELSPEQKKAEITKAMTFSGTKEEMRERAKEFETFKEYLQHAREEMAQEIIRLTDTEAFSELKQVYDELNTSLLDFDEKMRPLTEIIDAIYTLRTNGLTLDAFKEIQDDRKANEDFRTIVEEISTERERAEEAIRARKREIAALGEQKSFFGFGGVKESARVAIEQRKLEIQAEQEKLLELDNKFNEANRKRQETSSKLGEFAEQKAKLRELLDISTDDHKERQKALVDAALTFVNTAKERVGSVRSHLGMMDGQVERLFDANSHMTRVYAVLGEGLKDAEKENQSIRDTLKPAENEDMITKITREEKQMAVDEHLATLSTSAVDTMATFADLTSQTIRIKTMREANRSQMDKARAMHSQGIAGVADRLSVVLQAVSSAALGESSAMAKDTLARMATNTNLVAQKESMRIAMGMTEVNDDLQKALDDLAQYGEVQRAATDITREAVSEMRNKLDELKAVAEGVQDDISEAIAVHADVGRGASKQAASKPSAKSSPFGI